jgi:NADH:ubiquinone oxidoreductase subunit 6 (subunit J)
MQPILFWSLAVISLVASALAVTTGRPVRALLLGVAVLGVDAGLVFGLEAPLLALEILLVGAAAALLSWTLVVRPRRLRLGAPGRVRMNISRLLALGAVLYLCVLLVWALAASPDVEPQPSGSLGGEFGSWAAGALLGGAATSAWVVTLSRRRRPDEPGEAP